MVTLQIIFAFLNGSSNGPIWKKPLGLETCVLGSKNGTKCSLIFLWMLSWDTISFHKFGSKHTTPNEWND